MTMEYVDYNELLSSYRRESNIPYSELLRTKEWKRKRDEIERRENHKCQECHSETVGFWLPKLFGNSGVFEVPAKLDLIEVFEDYICPHTGEVLFDYPEMKMTLVEETDPRFSQVHHTFYVRGHLPWEYENKYLLHLCDRCHRKLHEEQEIFIYESMDNRDKGIPVCKCVKCFGTGYLGEYHFYMGGICFECDGRGYI